jgi:hypothetical protein
MWDGQVWGLHELFPELPADPRAAETQVRDAASNALEDLVDSVLRRAHPVGVAKVEQHRHRHG